MTVAGLTGMASAGATPQATNSGIGTASWLVLANPGASAAVIAQQLKAAGATVPR